MNNKNRKEIEGFLNIFDGFRDDCITMYSAFKYITCLNSLLSSMEGNREDWVMKIRSNWLDIETGYGINLDKNNHNFNLEEMRIINEAAQEIRKLLLDAVEEYLKRPDKTIESIGIILEDEWIMCPDCLDAWKSITKSAMIVCPKCLNSIHNPRYENSRNIMNQNLTE